MVGFFERSEGRFTGDGGESLEEVLKSFAAFETVKKRLDGHTGSAKHRSSAEDIRVFGDDFHLLIVAP